MSGSSGMGEREKLFLGLKNGKTIEKSNFAQKCNLLSQYFKEKRSFGDINLKLEEKKEILLRGPTTMDFLAHMEKTVDLPRQSGTTTSLDLNNSTELPSDVADFSPSTSMEHPSKKVKTMQEETVEPASAQMTIFFAGKIAVFDDFPADKANEIVAMARDVSAKKAKSNTTNVVNNTVKQAVNAVENTPKEAFNVVNTAKQAVNVTANTSKEAFNVVNNAKQAVNVVANTPKEAVNVVNTVKQGAASSSQNANTASASGQKSTQEHIQIQPATFASDLPIARRASLHKFLAKRKDRATSKAPVQANHQNQTPESPKEEGPNASVDPEAESSKHLELRL